MPRIFESFMNETFNCFKTENLLYLYTFELTCKLLNEATFVSM